MYLNISGEKEGEALEVQLFAFGEGVADFEDAVVGQTYDVAGGRLRRWFLCAGP